MKAIQFTLFSTTGKYRPISTITKLGEKETWKDNKQDIIKRSILNICHNRRTTYQELKKDGYTQYKIREYDKEKIEEQNKLNKRIRLIKKIQEQREQQKKEQQETTN